MRLLLPGVACATSCARKEHAETRAAVRDMALREDLLIICSRLAPAIFNSPEAFTVTGADVGPLALVDRPYDRSVSPDGAWVAWVPLSSLPHLGTEQPLVLFTNDPRSVQSVKFKGRHADQVAISSNAGHLALTAVVDEALHSRLIVLNPATAELEHDLTELITRFRLSEVERLRISANGGLLAIASRESFVIVDVPSRKVMLETYGRFPSPSPRGDSLAFLDNRRDLTIAIVSTGARKVIASPFWTVAGVGGWSPDSRFLLVGARPVSSVFIHLVAIDCFNGEFAEIMRLDEGDRGETSVWIKRRLLSA